MKKNSKGISLDGMAGVYDRITFTERSRFRSRQVDHLDLRPGESVLEVGCGTASLAILAKRVVGADGVVEGLDLAPRMIEKAEKKAQRAGLSIGFTVGSVDELPYEDGRFDAVISSLMFHHLPIEVKEKGLFEIHRVLKPSGRMLLSDFCVPRLATAPLMVPLLIWTSATRYQLFGKLSSLIDSSPFESVRLIRRGWFLNHYLLTKAPQQGSSSSTG